jgi:type VI secretion system protein ImpA
LKQADWEAVSAIGGEALATQSKDLQIAAWLLEAWIQLHGMAGVRAGLELIGRLCEHYWDTIHPQLAGADLEQRLSPFRWINEKLYQQLKQIPLTQPRTGDTPAYTWLDWESALYWEHAVKHNGHAGDPAATDGNVTTARFRESSMVTPTTFYVALDADLNGAITATQALERYLHHHCGDQAPALSQFVGTLRDMHSKVTATLANRDSGEAAELCDAGPTGGRHISDEWLIHSREDAYQKMDAIADYLLRIEPHSPTPFLVKRAVSWGSLPLTELVLEIVQSRSDQEAIFALLGIKQGGS